MKWDILHKYTKKILTFINAFKKHDLYKSISGSINENIKCITASNLTSELTQIISRTFKTSYDYTITKLNIDKLHDKTDVPIMYIFFCKLHDADIINKFIHDPDNIYDFTDILSHITKFIQFYNHHAYKIDISKMFSVIEKYCSDENILELYNLIYKSNNSRSELHTLLYNNKFIALDIQHDAETCIMTKYSIHNDDFNLVIYCKNTDDITDYIHNFIHILYIMIEIGKYNNNTKKPYIIMFLSHQKKQYSINDNILSATNINSGTTISGNLVMISRKEESHKVLFHEMIHFYGLDFNTEHNGYNKLKDYIMQKYNIQYVDSPNESYTEMLAIIINSHYIAFYTDIPISIIIEYEMLFTLFQISKILNFYNMSSCSDLGKKQIMQTTSVFSYFIIKGSLMFNLSEFINMINDSVKSLRITHKINLFSELVKKSLENMHITDGIDTFMKYYNILDIDNKSFIFRTLRMSCFHL